ncbi:TPA: efflux RND transporter periplasmic adaptor subunit [Vibrio vulnificus]|uniref:efflux RND transporter periplasmic adaptor subunit n=1 Tax=Vibrio vulnificus TaxID=672 RepID=UPI001A2B8954|nr:efflux RND transporter periplasmic adaptor subunit [Vibrio vulnificus]MCA0778607.1 efflux RND transporter periplasmic adaptor subunit [Vibrio vulnificus]WIL73232.1 efflux RND transporter periplasmic adaptor subunit [Vibrio vulnificus]HAS6045311.1 efflux RND transporter periplasmic adaptor subunit [Vibrio vulnificus]HAS6214857.1 efflux RND transporter periplasmic adaptor subunit [Vibrio vulnificus]HAT8504369.1 efflux RND transporter periplasmic adaptor subunit [Vibrio vulnificus]
MKFRKPLSVLVGLAAILMALVVVDELAPEPNEAAEKQALLSPVSVLEVTPSLHQSRLTLLGITAARWPVKLKASSSAQLKWLDERIEPGSLVKQGQVLARLDTAAVNATLAQSLSVVKQAELELQQALHEQTVALKMLNSKTSSSFARREPQVLAAQANLTQAKQAYVSAQKLLEESVITAPFDAVIIKRHISPREWIEAGQVTFELAASDSIDVELPISQMHWQQVQAALTEPSISVVNRAGHHWPAKVRYVSPLVDTSTRQRQVVLAVQSPYQNKAKLYPNQQVQAEIDLGLSENVVSVPLSAMTRDGYVWTLDRSDRLRKESVTFIGQGHQQLNIRFDEQSAQVRRVVQYPLASMLSGKQVAPVVSEQDPDTMMVGRVASEPLSLEKQTSLSAEETISKESNE